MLTFPDFQKLGRNFQGERNVERLFTSRPYVLFSIRSLSWLQLSLFRSPVGTWIGTVLEACAHVSITKGRTELGSNLETLYSKSFRINTKA